VSVSVIIVTVSVTVILFVTVSVSVSVKLTSSVVGGVDGRAQKDCEVQIKRERLQIVVPPVAEPCRVFRVTAG
jgi:hypothetical protein